MGQKPAGDPVGENEKKKKKKTGPGAKVGARVVLLRFHK